MRAHSDEQGVTLVELIVAIAIIGVVIAALYLSYFTGVRVFGFNQERVEFHRDQRLISESIGKYIRQADEIYISNDNKELLIKYNNSNEEIKFYKNNNYLYVDNDPYTSGGERKISQLIIDNDDIFNDNGNKEIDIKIKLLNDDNNRYTFKEKFSPRIKDVDYYELTP
jgi:prepilin-type N-terminal cleavage/methylation domain-containing protein